MPIPGSMAEVPFKATPYVGTVVKLDSPETVLQEPPSGEMRGPDEIARDAFAAVASDTQATEGAKRRFHNVRRVPGVGIQLAPYQASAGAAAERTVAQAGIMRPVAEGGTLNASPFLGRFAGYSQDPDGSYDAGNAETGDDHYQLALPADKTPADADLASDRAAFPGPTSEASASDVRIAVDTVPDEPGKPLHLKISVQSAIVSATQELGKVYFVGPASQANAPAGNVQGYGYYCLRLMGDGLARLYEYRKLPTLGELWDLVQDGIRWCPKSMVAGSAHHLEIIPHEFAAPRGGRTGYVVIVASDTGYSAPQNAGSFLQLWGSVNPGGFLKFYSTCDDAAKWVPARHKPVRLDHRDDAQPAIQLSRPVYPAEGYVVDDPYETFVFPGYSGAEFRAYFLGDVPPGTTARIDVFKEGDDPVTGTPIVPTGRTSAPYGQVASYQIPPNTDGVDVRRSFLVRVWLTSEGSATPTIEKVAFVKDGAAETYDPGETTIRHPVLEYQGTGKDDETGRESMSFDLADLHGQATQLAVRSEMPFRVTVPYPEGPIGVPVTEDSPRSVIMRGYVDTAPSEKLYRPPTVGPSGATSFASDQGLHVDARRYRGQAVGMHKRLDEAVVPLGYDLSDDPQIDAEKGSKTPSLACDAIRYFVLWSGFEEAQIGWDWGDPRYPERLWPKEGEGASPGTVNPGAPIGETAMSFARDYLGRVLDFEANSSRTAPADGEDPTGMWEFVDPPRAPYRPLARFENAPVPGGSGLYFAHVPWPDWTYRGRAVPVRCILRGETKTPISPEFNWLLVVGLGNVVGHATPVKLTTTVPNVDSMNAIATVASADPTSVSYVGRPKRALYVNSNLATPEAVQFAGARLLQYAGTGRILRTFTAPLVLVWDEDAPYLRRKRPLRPNDCVVVRSRMCVVKACAPFASKDGFQMMRIEAQELPEGSYPPL